MSPSRSLRLAIGMGAHGPERFFEAFPLRFICSIVDFASRSLSTRSFGLSAGIYALQALPIRQSEQIIRRASEQGTELNQVSTVGLEKALLPALHGVRVDPQDPGQLLSLQPCGPSLRFDSVQWPSS